MINNTCLKCGEVLNSSHRKFCNDVCRTRYHSIKRYLRLKDSPEYKKYRREYFKKWRLRNREKHNKVMSENYHKRRGHIDENGNILPQFRK